MNDPWCELLHFDGHHQYQGQGHILGKIGMNANGAPQL